MKSFYLYIDNFSFSDIFSTNNIACEEYCPNKKGAKTVSRNTKQFLFITHKKLNRESRLRGIEDQLTGWPVVLELAIDESKYDSFPVFFVVGNEKKIVPGELCDYDVTKYDGCFVFADIPFSTISKVFFECQEQLFDSDKSIFPDFMWKQEIVSVINQEEFVEAFEINIADSEILAYMKDNVSANQVCLYNNKLQAALLQLVNGSRGWTIGKYKSSYDSTLLDIFHIDKAYVNKYLEKKDMPKPDIIASNKSENLKLLPEQLKHCADISSNQGMYDLLVYILLKNQDKCTPEVVSKLLCEIKEAVKSSAEADKILNIIDQIDGCSRNAMGFSLDETLRCIDKEYGENSILRALFFTMKNPGEFDKFMLSLSIYKVDSLTARRSMVLWAFLNGTKGIPAKSYNRENGELWFEIENICSQMLANEYPFTRRNKVNRKTDSFCGISISCEEVISEEEVYRFLIEDKKKITTSLLKEIYTIVKNMDRKVAKEDPYCVYVLNDSNFYSMLPHTNLSQMGKSDIDVFEKEFAKKSKALFAAIKKKPEYDYGAIYRDWIADEKKFKKIWEVYETKLIAFYLKSRDK